MKCYIELTLLPSAEINLYFLWSKIFQPIHLAFVAIQDEQGNVPIGIAFPQYDAQKYQLGDKLRLFALDARILEDLRLSEKLKHFLDYVHLTKIREVPDRVHAYSVYQRQQSNRSQAKLYRTIKRKALRERIDLEEAKNQLETQLDNKVKETKNEKFKMDFMPSLKVPYLQIKSLSSGKRFCLFIAKYRTEE